MRITQALLFLALLLGQTMAAERGVGEYVYKQLARAHELMDAGQYAQALKRLKQIRPTKMTQYEQALVQQTYGYIYASMDELDQAIDAFKKSLVPPVLSPDAKKNSLYNLAQLQLASGDASASLATLEQWFRLERHAPASAHALAGTAYAETKQYAEAIEHLRQAIASEGGAAESWRRQLLAIYYDVANYQAAAQLLEEMVKQFPAQKAYWLQLSSVYRRLHDDSRSLAVLELADQQGLLTGDKELTELIHYYLYMDLPFLAGERLDRALRERAVNSTSEHWRLLSDTWLAAKETGRAVSAMQRAAELAQDAESYLRLARLAAQAEDWNLVIEAVDRMFAIDSPNDPGQGLLLKGIAHYHRGDHKLAKTVLEQASANASVRTDASEWLDYMNAD